MRFREDSSEKGWFWVDRRIDEKVDHFNPCHPCRTALEETGLERKVWTEFDLCYECNTRLEILSAIHEIQGERPLNMDREPEIIHLESDPLGDFNYEFNDPYRTMNDPLDFDLNRPGRLP